MKYSVVLFNAVSCLHTTKIFIFTFCFAGLASQLFGSTIYKSIIQF